MCVCVLVYEAKMDDDACAIFFSLCGSQFPPSILAQKKL